MPSGSQPRITPITGDPSPLASMNTHTCAQKHTGIHNHHIHIFENLKLNLKKMEGLTMVVIKWLEGTATSVNLYLSLTALIQCLVQYQN